MPDFSMKKSCQECPWLLSSRVGKFPPERYLKLADTCKPGGIPGVQAVFACHMTPEGAEMACAGMMKVCGEHSNSIRLAMIVGRLDLTKISVSGPTYNSFRELAIANGCDSNAPEFDGLPE